jgi:thiosulfate/3-mercaptopyruvate sulfurtransferase
MMRDLLVEPGELMALPASAETVVIDTRPREVYAEGHIPGAVLLPGVYDYLVTDTGAAGLQQLDQVLAGLFSQAGLTGRERVVFCEQETGMRCARGLWLLQYAGHPSVSVLHGGLEGWLAAGGKLTTEVPRRTRTEFAVRPRADLLATAATILSRQGQPNFLLLDVRREEEFRGTFYQCCCARSGRIPGALWFDWEHVLAPPRLRPPDQIRAELSAAGVTPDKEIVTYCHRGARSANTYLALKLLGYPDVRNYIGSWHEWSNRPELPMESGG